VIKLLSRIDGNHFIYNVVAYTQNTIGCFKFMGIHLESKVKYAESGFDSNQILIFFIFKNSMVNL